MRSHEVARHGMRLPRSVRFRSRAFDAGYDLLNLWRRRAGEKPVSPQDVCRLTHGELIEEIQATKRRAEGKQGARACRN